MPSLNSSKYPEDTEKRYHDDSWDFRTADTKIISHGLHTYPDMMMVDYDAQFPMYNWKKNKGYPTLEHKQAIADYGICDLHRKTFNMAIQLKLDL